MRPLLFLLLLCLTLTAYAQDNLVLGAAQSIAISADAPTLREYTGRAGESIRVSAIVGDAGENTPDLVLWIVYAGQLLAYNDNQAESGNPMISLTLPTNGLYQIYVDSFNGVSVGNAELLLETFDPFNVVAGENSLQFDLPAAQVFRHQFPASGQTSISVKDLSGGLDPYIRLLNGAGLVLAENDDHASADLTLGLFDSLLSLRLNAGIYTLEIRDFLGRAGRLELLFN